MCTQLDRYRPKKVSNRYFDCTTLIFKCSLLNVNMLICASTHQIKNRAKNCKVYALTDLNSSVQPQTDPPHISSSTSTNHEENHDVLIHFLTHSVVRQHRSSNTLSTILQTTLKISFMLTKPPPLVQITQLVPTSCFNLKTTSQSSTTT